MLCCSAVFGFCLIFIFSLSQVYDLVCRQTVWLQGKNFVNISLSSTGFRRVKLNGDNNNNPGSTVIIPSN